MCVRCVAPRESKGVRAVKLQHRVIPLLLCLVLVCLVLGACALTSTAAGPTITPVPTIIARQRPPVLVQFCTDDTGSYPRGYFSRANKKVADSLAQSVVPNSSGLILYATLIASMTFDPTNTLNPFIIPSISNYPTLPTPLPTPSESNPISYSATATAAAGQQDGAIRAYNTQMAALNAQLQMTRTQVSNDAKRLTNWNPRVDSTATSVWGCLQLARQRFASQPGVKYLIIDSDMQNNTNVDYTADFTSSKALNGVNVHVIYYYCQVAGSCQDLQAKWTRVFTGSGAASVKFDDPAQSDGLPNLFGGA
jgi:hypothetical protein